MKHERADEATPERVSELTELAEWRGISIQTLLAAQVHVTEDGWWGIPYLHMTGSWYTRKRYPGTPPAGVPKFLSPKKAQPHLYNPLRLGPNVDEVWFCEGEFDTLSLVDAGVPAIGYPGVETIVEYGDDSGEERKVRFKDSWRLLFSECTVVAAGDMDDAGKRAIRGILRAFSPNSYHFQVNTKFGDINDWWREDAAGLAGAIDEFRRER